MDVKWFFVIVGIFLTFAILIGMYFIGTFIVLQSQKQYESSQQAQVLRFENSTKVHQFLFDNITDVKISLDDIVHSIGNLKVATDQRNAHYNQSQFNSEKLDQILNILNNESSSSGGIIIENVTPAPVPKPTDLPPQPPLPTPTPLPAPLNNTDVNDNETDEIIIENITVRN